MYDFLSNYRNWLLPPYSQLDTKSAVLYKPTCDDCNWTVPFRCNIFQVLKEIFSYLKMLLSPLLKSAEQAEGSIK